MLVSTLFTIFVIGFVIVLTILDIIKKRKRNKIDDYPRNTRKDLIGLLFLNPDDVPFYKTILTVLYVCAICYICFIVVEFLVQNWNNTVLL
jgi:hypothetical protein